MRSPNVIDEIPGVYLGLPQDNPRPGEIADAGVCSSTEALEQRNPYAAGRHLKLFTFTIMPRR